MHHLAGPGPDDSCCGSCYVYCRMCGSIPSFYPLDASRPSPPFPAPMMVTKNGSGIDNCSLGWEKPPSVQKHRPSPAWLVVDLSTIFPICHHHVISFLTHWPYHSPKQSSLLLDELKSHLSRFSSQVLPALTSNCSLIYLVSKSSVNPLQSLRVLWPICLPCISTTETPTGNTLLPALR